MNESAVELRRSFLQFFADRGHRVVPSAPLVPVGDATLLFTTAGMVQFKPLFGVADPDYRRAASVQKCLRATDIDNVGHTIRHHTFFEMLGNFSFGDYFKHDAIVWAWEYVTGVLGIPAEPIWVSVHTSDDEAAAIWERETDVPASRIVRLGDEDNFWGPAGGTGACGPCSEMYWDLGAAADPSTGEGQLTVGGRYIEFWNLVFPQFDQVAEGERRPLTHPGIDTGMGLERLAVVTQQVATPYDTDLFRPLVAHLLDLAGLDRAPDGEPLVALRIVADHLRGLAFALADGVVFSNEGRGYLLRRLLRRASRRGRALGLEGPFLHRLVPTLVDRYGGSYPELERLGAHVEQQMLAEEERFARTLEAGVNRFEAIVARVRQAGGSELGGDDVFKLYDTYGFPVDLTTEMAGERGLGVDLTGFERAMEGQRRMAQAAHQFGTDGEASGDDRPWTVVGSGDESGDSVFVGYDQLSITTRVRRHRQLAEGLELVLAATPFYAESGGQVGDTGWIVTSGNGKRGARFEVDDTVRGADGAIVHRGHLVEGALEALTTGEVEATVDAERRRAIMRNHTATHLMHAALRAVLGEHVQQHGSMVAPDRLRFDFSHYAALTDDERRAVEDRVNRAILANQTVAARQESYDEATARGAMALFGEKYGREVRTIEVPGESLELCGGTHCRGTGDIGLFKIVSESAIQAGIRRIVAVTGLGALELARELEERLAGLGSQLGVAPRALPERLTALLGEIEELRARSRAAQGGALERQIEAALAAAEEQGGHRLVVARLAVGSVDLLRRAGDGVRDQLGSGAAVLGAEMNGKVSFLAVVTDDLIEDGALRADELVRAVAKVAGGSGGGKPHQALAGGKQVEQLDAALEVGRRLIRERLESAARR